jgi:hypothetical protein
VSIHRSCGNGVCLRRMSGAAGTRRSCSTMRAARIGFLRLYLPG